MAFGKRWMMIEYMRTASSVEHTKCNVIDRCPCAIYHVHKKWVYILSLALCAIKEKTTQRKWDGGQRRKQFERKTKQKSMHAHAQAHIYDVDGERHHKLNKCLMLTPIPRIKRHHLIQPILVAARCARSSTLSSASSLTLRTADILLVTGLDNWLMRCVFVYMVLVMFCVCECECCETRISFQLRFVFVIWREYVLSGIGTSAEASVSVRLSNQ